MSWIPLIILSLGFATVLQGGFNRQLAEAWGLPLTLVVNSFFVLAFSCVYLGLAYLLAPQDIKIHSSTELVKALSWKSILPGLFGFLFIFGIPFVLAKKGALQVFVGLVAAQLIASLLWDHFAEDISPSAWRVGGTLLAMLGALIVAFKS